MLFIQILYKSAIAFDIKCILKLKPWYKHVGRISKYWAGDLRSRQINPRRHKWGRESICHPLDIFGCKIFVPWPINKIFGTTSLCLLRDLALRTELPVICVTSILRSCLSSSHFACLASSIKLTNWRIFRAFSVPVSCHLRALFVPFSNLVRAWFEPGLCHFRAWLVPISSLVRSIFEPGSCHFRPCFLPFSSPLRAIFEHSSC